MLNKYFQNVLISFHCKIIDGYWRVSLGQYHEFNSPKVGSWIKIQFDKAYHLTFLRILPAPLKSQGGIKHLNVTTSDGSYLQVVIQIPYISFNLTRSLKLDLLQSQQTTASSPE